MGKSLDNAIFLSDPRDVVSKKVMGMYTDPGHIRAELPGMVEGNPVFGYLDAFDPDEAGVDDLNRRYRAGGLGAVAVEPRPVGGLAVVLAPVPGVREHVGPDPRAS